MLTYSQLEQWLEKHDRASCIALRTVRAMQGDGVAPVAADILGFVAHHYRGDPFADYAARVEGLRRLQKDFEMTGAYPASAYAEVKPVDDEVYKLALLLSLVCANHRFEILKELKRFLAEPIGGQPNLLSVGYGTGYELKLAREILPEWKIEAFDSSEQSHAYATDLLGFFKCGPVMLHQELFPLETRQGLEQYHGAFGKIVVCELLEHLENPAGALTNLRTALQDNGQMFLTMAINIAQEDHVFLYNNVQQARCQVLECGYKIIGEMLAPAALLPFKETQREKIFRKGNYVCVVGKHDCPQL